VRSAGQSGKLESIGQYQKPLTEVEAEHSRLNRELAEMKMERSRVEAFISFLKARVNAMLGFKRFRNAAVTISCIELVHRICETVNENRPHRKPLTAWL
jgi:transposase-like protein